ncbi:hypothetical protein Bca52824_032976 [Brassica carinata]|uniref:Uncharacterized protein n=1 Tax=Brassica carinata TaxID=52824 RepID=A0A8X7SD30_BRACI|nr:hypothetical protein Bca52824_032976 [Brassica carinata]
MLTSERVDLLLHGLTPACVCSSFILATGCCFRRQELTSTRFSEEATFEGLGCLCLSAESPLLRWLGLGVSSLRLVATGPSPSLFPLGLETIYGVYSRCYEPRRSLRASYSGMSWKFRHPRQRGEPHGSMVIIFESPPEMSSHVRSSVSGIDCEGWSDDAWSVCLQAEESAFRAVKGVPLSLGGPVARGGGLESRRRFLLKSSVCLGPDGRGRVVSGDICSTCDLRALEIRLLEGVCNSCCRRVSEHAVVLREVLLRSGVEGVIHGVSKAMLQPSSQSSSLFPSIRC